MHNKYTYTRGKEFVWLKCDINMCIHLLLCTVTFVDKKKKGGGVVLFSSISGNKPILFLIALKKSDQIRSNSDLSQITLNSCIQLQYVVIKSKGLQIQRHEYL